MSASNSIFMLSLALVLTTLISACTSTQEPETTSTNTASVARKSIRFYSANKRGQEDRLALLRNTNKYGCQNVSSFRKAYRVAVIGFKTCSVYSEQDCPEAAAIAATWDGSARRDPNKKNPTTKLTAGTSWIIGFEGEDKPNTPIRSWSCN